MVSLDLDTSLARAALEQFQADLAKKGSEAGDLFGRAFRQAALARTREVYEQLKAEGGLSGSVGRGAPVPTRPGGGSGVTRLGPALRELELQKRGVAAQAQQSETLEQIREALVSPAASQPTRSLEPGDRVRLPRSASGSPAPGTLRADLISNAQNRKLIAAIEQVSAARAELETVKRSRPRTEEQKQLKAERLQELDVSTAALERRLEAFAASLPTPERRAQQQAFARDRAAQVTTANRAQRLEREAAAPVAVAPTPTPPREAPAPRPRAFRSVVEALTFDVGESASLNKLRDYTFRVERLRDQLRAGSPEAKALNDRLNELAPRLLAARTVGQETVSRRERGGARESIDARAVAQRRRAPLADRIDDLEARGANVSRLRNRLGELTTAQSEGKFGTFGQLEQQLKREITLLERKQRLLDQSARQEQAQVTRGARLGGPSERIDARATAKERSARLADRIEDLDRRGAAVGPLRTQLGSLRDAQSKGQFGTFEQEERVLRRQITLLERRQRLIDEAARAEQRGLSRSARLGGPREPIRGRASLAGSPVFLEAQQRSEGRQNQAQFNLRGTLETLDRYSQDLAQIKTARNINIGSSWQKASEILATTQQDIQLVGAGKKLNVGQSWGRALSTLTETKGDIQLIGTGKKLNLGSSWSSALTELRSAKQDVDLVRGGKSVNLQTSWGQALNTLTSTQQDIQLIGSGKKLNLGAGWGSALTELRATKQDVDLIRGGKSVNLNRSWTSALGELTNTKRDIDFIAGGRSLRIKDSWQKFFRVAQDVRDDIDAAAQQRQLRDQSRGRQLEGLRASEQRLTAQAGGLEEKGVNTDRLVRERLVPLRRAIEQGDLGLAKKLEAEAKTGLASVTTQLKEFQRTGVLPKTPTPLPAPPPVQPQVALRPPTPVQQGLESQLFGARQRRAQFETQLKALPDTGAEKEALRLQNAIIVAKKEEIALEARLEQIQRRRVRTARPAAGGPPGAPPPPPPPPPGGGLPLELRQRPRPGLRQRAGAFFGSDRFQGALSSGLIGGAFPLLFGQGVGASAGGLLGGLGGGALGGGFGFGASLVGTVLGAQLDAAVQRLGTVGNALKDPVARFGELAQAGLLSSSALEKNVQALIESGRTAEARALIEKDLADSFGDISEASLFATETDKLNRAFAAVSVQLSSFVAGPLADFAQFLRTNLPTPGISNQRQLDFAAEADRVVGQGANPIETIGRTTLAGLNIPFDVEFRGQKLRGTATELRKEIIEILTKEEIEVVVKPKIDSDAAIELGKIIAANRLGIIRDQASGNTDSLLRRRLQEVESNRLNEIATTPNLTALQREVIDQRAKEARLPIELEITQRSKEKVIRELEQLQRLASERSRALLDARSDINGSFTTNALQLRSGLGDSAARFQNAQFALSLTPQDETLQRAAREAGQELNLAIETTGERLKRNIRDAAQALKSAGESLRSARESAFRFLTPGRRQQVLAEARGDIQRGVNAGEIDPGAAARARTPERILELANASRGILKGREDLEKAGTDLQNSAKALSDAATELRQVFGGQPQFQANVQAFADVPQPQPVLRTRFENGVAIIDQTYTTNLDRASDGLGSLSSAAISAAQTFEKEGAFTAAIGNETTGVAAANANLSSLASPVTTVANLLGEALANIAANTTAINSLAGKDWSVSVSVPGGEASGDVVGAVNSRL